MPCGCGLDNARFLPYMDIRKIGLRWIAGQKPSREESLVPKDNRVNSLRLANIQLVAKSPYPQCIHNIDPQTGS